LSVPAVTLCQYTEAAGSFPLGSRINFRPIMDCPVAGKWLTVDQCFSTAGPRPGTGPWHQLHRAARCSPGICHFIFL